MNDEFPEKTDKAHALKIPETGNLFKVDINKPLNMNKVELFHTTLGRGFFYENEQDRTFSQLFQFYALE